MQRKFVVASAIAAVVVAALMPGAGLGSSAAANRGAPVVAPDAMLAPFGVNPYSARFAPAAAKRPDHPEMGVRAAMSADGTTALVAAPGVGRQTGAIYVYHASDAASWTSSSTPMATLSSPAPHGFFGGRVVLSADGTTAFIGAPFRTNGAGAVYVYHVADESSWTSATKPAAVLTVNHSYFLGEALSVSADGTTLVVGAPDGDNGAGEAYIFHASAENAWVSSSTPSAALSNLAESGSDQGVGGVVALSDDGTTALISDTGAASAAGGAYIYHVASEALWTTSSTPTAILSNASGFAYDLLGASLSLSGDGTTAFIGAYGVNHLAGAIDVFHTTAEDAWVSSSTPTAILTNASGAKNDGLGGVVRASSDGLTVLGAAADAAKIAGRVDLFHVASESAWTTTSAPTATLTAPTRAPGDALGVGLALSADGTTAVIGAPGVNWITGDALVFHVADAGSWLTTSSPAATLTNAALPKPMCVVPRLRGEPVDFAKYDLSDSDCRIGKIKRVHVKNRRWRGFVLSQKPAAGHAHAAGFRVSVKVGK